MMANTWFEIPFLMEDIAVMAISELLTQLKKDACTFSRTALIVRYTK